MQEFCLNFARIQLLLESLTLLTADLRLMSVDFHDVKGQIVCLCFASYLL